MKKAIILFVFSMLLFIAALVVGRQTMQDHASSAGAGQRGEPIPDTSVPTVVLPPEQLPQFQKISVYTPQKRDDTLFLNPPDDNEKPKNGELESVKAGVM